MNHQKVIFTTISLAFAGAALAHGDHAAQTPGFLAGLAHPFSGLDHWLIAIALGVWAGHGLAAGNRIGQGSRLALLMAAALYGGSHGVLLVNGSYGAGFAAGFAASTLLLVGAGVLAYRALIGHRATARN